jgi:ParB family chromosome partitioning protein
MSTTTRSRSKKAAPPAPPKPVTEVEAMELRTAALDLGNLTSINLDLIDPDPENVRATAAEPEADAALRASIAQLGILEPPTVRPSKIDPGRFMVLMGHRRVAAAKALDLGSIRAIFVTGADADRIEAIQAAENMVRAAMHPVDVWRAVAHMTTTGTSERDAFQALGVGGRRGSLLQRLGLITGEALNIIARIPAARVEDMARPLHVISTAPHEEQLAALKKLKSRHGDPMTAINDLASALNRTVISADVAIFPLDGSKLVWIEDLFAEPTKLSRFTTTDIKGFLKEQSDALKAAVEAEAKAGHPIRLVSWDTKNGQPTIPSDLFGTYQNADRPAPKGGRDVILAAVAATGWQTGKVVRLRCTPKAKEKAEKTTRSKAANGEPAAPRPPLTHKGMNMLADAQQQAIRDALARVSDPTDMLAALVVALGSQNITVHGAPAGVDLPHTGWGKSRCYDLALEVAAAGPNATGEDRRQHVMIAAREAIARLIIVQAPKRFQHSGAPARWLGHMVRARPHMPPLDTEAMLQQASGEALREALKAAGAGVAGGAKKRADIIAALRDKAPAWMPVPDLFGPPSDAERDDLDQSKRSDPGRATAQDDDDGEEAAEEDGTVFASGPSEGDEADEGHEPESESVFGTNPEDGERAE